MEQWQLSAMYRRTSKRLYVYYARMIETNKYLNLTGITDMKEVVVKHMIDSLSCYDSNIIKPGMSIIDVGTGAGFPGIPLAIYDRSLKVTLFDSLKKTSYLPRIYYGWAKTDELYDLTWPRRGS